MVTQLDSVPAMSRRMVIILNILLVVIPVIYLSLWSLAGTSFFSMISNLLVSAGHQPLEIFTSGGMINPANITWTLTSKAMILLSKIIQLTPMLIVLFLLRLIFKNYKQNNIFVVKNAEYYRWIGALLLIDNFGAKSLSCFFSAIAAGVYHRENLSGVGFSLTEALIAILVLVISQVMLEGSRLAEENQLTV
ncbi:MAG: DUF2975 domain-containing protein [Legionellaceae bacterium]|nr:DUF2975 domain-containing protein [Legionellaceae bacterium]